MNKILKYNQAKYAIFDLVARNHLRTGDRLPSFRTMDKSFPFSAICLRRALDELQAQGFLEKKHGSGIYLRRSLDLWEKQGTVLCLQVGPDGESVSPEFSILRRYLHDRGIAMEMVAADHPNPNVLEKCKGCIGVLSSGYVTREWVAFLDSLGLPVLYIGRNEATEGRPAVGFDWEKAVQMAMERLLDHGKRTIGLITGASCWYPSHILAGQFLDSAREKGLKVSPEDILWKEPDDSHCIVDFLRKGPRYDGLLVEGGGLADYLVCHKQLRLPSDPMVGVIDRPGGNRSTDDLFFLDFDGSLYQEAAKAFFESLNDPGYFKDGPKLLEATFIPTSCREGGNGSPSPFTRTPDDVGRHPLYRPRRHVPNGIQPRSETPRFPSGTLSDRSPS